MLPPFFYDGLTVDGGRGAGYNETVGETKNLQDGDGPLTPSDPIIQASGKEVRHEQGMG